MTEKYNRGWDDPRKMTEEELITHHYTHNPDELVQLFRDYRKLAEHKDLIVKER